MANKFGRNESAETLPKSTHSITFLIHHQKKEPLSLTLKCTETVGKLIDTAKERLKYEHMIGLCSQERYFTLDFALLHRSTKLLGIKNNQNLDVLFEGIVAEYSNITLADFEFLSCIGQGISSAVYLVRHCANGRLYALKQIKKEYFRQFKTFESVLRQKKILSEMISDLPFVTKLQASFESECYLNFLLEFYPGGEFFYHLSHLKLTEDHAKVFFAEILLTMEQLHKRKILYRDLKPENIMVDFEGHLHLGDFGLCRINLEKEDLAHSHCGSPEYMAFETREDMGYGYAADFYTMGAIIYQMVKGVPPFYKHNPLQFSEVSEGFQQLVLALIERDPSQRLTNFASVKKSKWLRQIDWEQVVKKEYKLPTRLNYYINYIHEEFISKHVDNDEIRYQQKYDKLFDMFFYISDGKDSLAKYYPHLQKRYKIHRVVKTKQPKSNRSSSNSKTSQSKSKDKQEQTVTNRIKRSNIKNPNIYLSPSYRPENNKKVIPMSNKSLSKSKESKGTQSGNLIKFNKVASVKSTDFKAKEYLKEVERHYLKKK